MHAKASTICFTVVIFVLVTVCSGRSIKDDLTPTNLHRRRTGSISQTKNQADQHHNTADKRDQFQDYFNSPQGQALLSAKRNEVDDYISSPQGQAVLSDPNVQALFAQYKGAKRNEVDDYISSPQGQALLSDPTVQAYLARLKGGKRAMIH
ncbi:unnamed protein product [Adineta steineri]|uniref:RxLR effector protein n=1 Tax=Adineta steineri TaxID=433720 RepID=A0A816DDM4_9BILA|nr:unnamed protein product [Adineta steineri]CAF1632754.1 unnamed protein product [Adineta steineri]